LKHFDIFLFRQSMEIRGLLSAHVLSVVTILDVRTITSPFCSFIYHLFGWPLQVVGPATFVKPSDHETSKVQGESVSASIVLREAVVIVVVS
jgi:hypothetical protein